MDPQQIHDTAVVVVMGVVMALILIAGLVFEGRRR